MKQADTPIVEVQTGITEDQAVSQLLEKWGKADEAKAAKPEPKVEQPEPEAAEGEAETEQAQADAADAEPEAENEGEVGEIELDVAGEKFKVPKAFEEVATRMQAKAKEVEAGATRKFQEAAEARKAADTQIEAAKQLHRIAEANATLLGDHSMVMRRLQQLESINIAETDTDTLARLNAEYNQLTAAQKRINSQYAENVSNLRSEEAKAFAAKREHAEKQLAATLKGWGPEYAKRLAQYAESRGAPKEALQQISEAWMVQILDDAAYGRQMRDAKPQVDKRVAEAQKTLKPGASGQTKTAISAKVSELAARAKKTGRLEDAAESLLARMAQRRK